MDPKNEMIELGMNPDDGGKLMNGQEMPDGKLYHREHYEAQRPVMTVNGHELGDHET